MIKFKFTTLAVLLGLALASPALAQTPSNISMTVGVCNPVTPRNCAKPDASGNLPVTLSGSLGAVTIANGGDVALGATADAAWAGSGSGTLIAVQKYIAAKTEANRALLAAPLAVTQSGSWTNAVTQATAASLNATVVGTGTFATQATLQAGSALVGKVGFDQTNPGTTNGVQDASTSTAGIVVPAKAAYVGANSSGNLTGLIQADASVKLDVSTATTTQLVALSASKKIYITSWDVIAAGTGNVKLVYGTGAACGTGTTDLTGNYNLSAQAGISKGNGLGPVLVVPASNALCVTTSAAVQMSGSVAYTQF